MNKKWTLTAIASHTIQTSEQSITYYATIANHYEWIKKTLISQGCESQNKNGENRKKIEYN